MVQLRLQNEFVEVLGKRGAVSTVEQGHLPEVLPFFLHNWNGNDFSIDNQWFTDVTVAQSTTEERRSLVDRPYRVSTIRLTGLSRDESAAMWMFVNRMADKPVLVPVYSDVMRLTSSASATGTTVRLTDNHLRRCYAGMYFMLVTKAPNGRATQFEVVKASEVILGTSGMITTVGPLVNSYSGGDLCYPMMVSEIGFGSTGRALTRYDSDMILRVEEAAGHSAIPAWIANGDDPPGTPTYRQIAIFPNRVDWLDDPSVGVSRSGTTFNSGRGKFVDLQGRKPRWVFQHRMQAIGRQASFDLLMWMDSRMGRARPFWFPNPMTFFDHRAAQPSLFALDFELHDLSMDDLRQFVRHVYVEFTDGTSFVRACNARFNSTGSWGQLLLDESLPNSTFGKTIRRMTTCHLVRHDADNYGEDWSTAVDVAVAVKLVEVDEERNVQLETFDEPITSVSPTTAPVDSWMWLVAGNSMFQPGGSTPAQNDGDDIGTWLDSIPNTGMSVMAGVTSPQIYHQAVGQGSNCRFHNEVSPYTEKPFFVVQKDETPYTNGRGMTIAMSFKFRESFQQQDETGEWFCRIPNAAGDGTDIFEWNKERVILYEDEGVEDQDLWIEFPGVGFPHGTLHTMVLVWNPGRFTRVYQGGLLRGEAGRSPFDLPVFRRKMELMRFTNFEGDDITDDDRLFRQFLVIRRAVSVQELNQVGASLGGAWQKVY